MHKSTTGPRFYGAWYDCGVIAFYLLGGIPIYAFSLLMAVGAFVGLAWMAWQSPEEDALRRVDAGLWVLLGGIMGARAMYVAINWDHFQGHPWESLQISLGGLTWPGALAGGLICLALYTGLFRLPVGELVDALVPLLTSLVVSAWLGCWLDGCAYGPSAAAWWSLPARDEWGTVAPRAPIQPLGAVLTVGLFWILERFADRARLSPGALASLGLLGLSLLLFWLSFLRDDPAPLWHDLRLDAWAALAFTGLAVLALFVFTIKARLAKYSSGSLSLTSEDELTD